MDSSTKGFWEICVARTRKPLLAIMMTCTLACHSTTLDPKNVSRVSGSSMSMLGGRVTTSCDKRPPVQVGDNAFLMYLHIRNALMKPSIANRELAQVVKDRLKSIGGMPRAQLAGILRSAMERAPTALANQTCAAPSTYDDRINQIFDEILATFGTRSPSELAKDVVALSLSDCPIDEAQERSMITEIPDSDQAPWTEVSSKSPLFDIGGFPLAEGEAITFANGLKAVPKWESKHTRELLTWKKEFDKVPDCKDLAAAKKVPKYTSWASCIEGMTPDDVQMLAGKVVFNWSYEMLVKDGQELSSYHDYFRGVTDKRGRLQGFTVVDHDVDIGEFRRKHFAAISNRAKQIPAVYIYFLVTAPWNLEAQGKKKVKGVGSALVALGVLESQRRAPWGGRVLLESMPSAASFYQRIGFWRLGTRTSIATDFYPFETYWMEMGKGQKILERSGLKVQNSH